MFNSANLHNKLFFFSPGAFSVASFLPSFWNPVRRKSSENRKPPPSLPGNVPRESGDRELRRFSYELGLLYFTDAKFIPGSGKDRNFFRHSRSPRHIRDRVIRRFQERFPETTSRSPYDISSGIRPWIPRNIPCRQGSSAINHLLWPFFPSPSFLFPSSPLIIVFEGITQFMEVRIREISLFAWKKAEDGKKKGGDLLCNRGLPDESELRKEDISEVL